MKRFFSILPALLALTVLLFTGCDKYIYEDLEECPQGVYISFYHQTPCMDEPIPVGEVEGLYVFAFDLNDVLVKKERVEGSVDLVKAYKVELPPVEKGQYSFIAWAGATKKYFDLGDFVEGKTTKTDIMMSLREKGGNAASLQDHAVWQGESKVVSLPDRKTHGSVFDEISINMLEVTNRINLTLKLHESVCEKLDIDDFEIMISSANGTTLINKRMPLNAAKLNYPGTKVSKDETSIKLVYTLMELKSGYNNVLKVYNKKEDKTYFLEDLLGKVLLENPNVNLECEHDFDIVMEIEDKCKDCPDNNMVVNILINNYPIHSFPVELSNRY
ncbi:FimB/Mfa2 family fimbrial subunit [Porphyromonas levii]|uniref:FimB/Mfa2 family fimbrial subunit n=1 Tax=Porphyromonas levii TaxID=28114 RepID=UPI001BA88BB1|nr:FimB/Mfa2 family fimbrial subunit [Porphyromonas levii]MBR8704047.1 Minor fimbrium anchoring subunit Mfa2 [Porphyromonas levii]